MFAAAWFCGLPWLDLFVFAVVCGIKGVASKLGRWMQITNIYIYIYRERERDTERKRNLSIFQCPNYLKTGREFQIGFLYFAVDY